MQRTLPSFVKHPTRNEYINRNCIEHVCIETRNAPGSTGEQQHVVFVHLKDAKQTAWNIPFTTFDQAQACLDVIIGLRS